MKLWKKIALSVSLLLVVGLAVVVFGGSLVWWVLGFEDDLAIDGRAPIIAEIDVEPRGWGAYGGDPGGSRFSGARQIDRSNVKALGVAWEFRTGALEGRPRDVVRRTAFENTPVLVGDKLIACTPFNVVIALHPATGKEIWRFDPGIDPQQRPANQFVCRGVSQWRDTQAGAAAACSTRVFMGTNDSRVVALDANTGRPCAGFGRNGEVQLEPSIALRWPGEQQVTSAPAIVGDIVVVGSAISDNVRVAAPAGVVHALDARTGEIRWTFDPVPRAPEASRDSDWTSQAAVSTGQANVWSTISVDEKRGWIFLPTSSPSPDFFGGLRPGDNRYANSVVAIEGATGRVIWSFQTVHHDVWDYDLPSQPGLYTLTVAGVTRDVVVQTAKTGLIFVLDRETGEPVIPVEERQVPQGGAPGELLSPTQPFPVTPPPLVPNTTTPDKAFGVTIFDKMACADMIQKARAEGLFTPPSEQGTLFLPFTGGGANWGSSAFDPRRNLLVVNMSNIAQLIKLIPAEQVAGIREASEAAEIAPMEGSPFGVSRETLVSPLGLPCTPPPWGVIAGVDVAKGEIVWRRVLGTTRDVAPLGIEIATGMPNLGGPIATAGDLIFISAAFDSYLRALDTETGDELWRATLPASSVATPMTYEWEGVQYVVVASGGYGNFDSRMGDFITAYALSNQ